jgi:hypothetical protein
LPAGKKLFNCYPVTVDFSASRLLPEAGLEVVWQQFYQREGLSQGKQKKLLRGTLKIEFSTRSISVRYCFFFPLFSVKPIIRGTLNY